MDQQQIRKKYIAEYFSLKNLLFLSLLVLYIYFVRLDLATIFNSANFIIIIHISFWIIVLLNVPRLIRLFLHRQSYIVKKYGKNSVEHLLKSDIEMDKRVPTSLDVDIIFDLNKSNSKETKWFFTYRSLITVLFIFTLVLVSTLFVLAFI